MGHNHALPSNPGTQWVVVSAGIAWERAVMGRSQMVEAFSLSSDDRRRHRRRHPSEHRRHTLNMGTWAGTGKALAWYIVSVMSPPPPLAMGATVGHTGSHKVRIPTLSNIHVRMTHTTSLGFGCRFCPIIHRYCYRYRYCTTHNTFSAQSRHKITDPYRDSIATNSTLTHSTHHFSVCTCMCAG